MIRFIIIMEEVYLLIYCRTWEQCYGALATRSLLTAARMSVWAAKTICKSGVSHWTVLQLFNGNTSSNYASAHEIKGNLLAKAYMGSTGVFLAQQFYAAFSCAPGEEQKIALIACEGLWRQCQSCFFFHGFLSLMILLLQTLSYTTFLRYTIAISGFIWGLS